MKKDKNALYYRRILDALLSGQIYPILKLAVLVGVSEKTVRTKINQLNICLEGSSTGYIRKKTGVGVWLEVSSEQKDRIRRFLDSEKMEIALDLGSRNRQLIGKLLKQEAGKIITISQLAQSLYLSAPTVAGMMKDVQPWFQKRRLEIRPVRNRGICLMGDEYNYRLAVKDYLLDVMPDVMEALLGNFAVGIDIYRIRRIIVNAENAWRIELADISFNMVWILVSLSLTRHRPEQEHHFEESQEENIQYYVEYSFAESVYQRISREFQIEPSGNDIVLLAILLISAKRMNTILDINSKDCTRQYDENLRNFVRTVIETIDSVLDEGLMQDAILFDSLLIHMRSAIFRLKYSAAVPEGISKYVKNEYKQTFLAIWSTSHLFEEQYGIQVTEDELAGITLYIQAALIRQKKDKPLTAVLVSQTGLARSQLIVEMIKYKLPEITEIKVVSNHDFAIRQYPEVDMVISTAKISVTDCRIVHIGDRISEGVIERIREKACEIQKARQRQHVCFHNLCHQLFDKDLIFVRPEVQDKTELITMMVRKMEERGDVTEHFLTSVLERENATTTSIGRGMAIPHGNMMESNEARVAVALLKTPLDWCGESVDMVFLLGVKMTSALEVKKTKRFYKDFLVLTEHDDNLKALKAMNSALEVYQYFIR